MNLTKKIRPYTLVLAIGASTLTGATAQSVSGQSWDLGEAMKVLKTTDFSMLEMYPNGYISSKIEDINLRTLAGIYAGTVKVKKVYGRYAANGFYSQASNPEAMLKVLKDADKDGNRIITDDEVRTLTMKVYQENAK